MAKPEFTEQIRRRFSDSDVRVIPPSFLVDLTPIGTGVLLIHATWSAPSIASLGCWPRIVSIVDGPKPWLYIMDADSITPEWELRVLGRRIGGNGEAFWIRNRTIVARKGGYALQCDALVEPTRQLFQS